MVTLSLAHGHVTQSDELRISLVKPDHHPARIMVVWPTQPSTLAPDTRALADMASAMVKIVATAQAELVKINKMR
jgi:hypothetical protein